MHVGIYNDADEKRRDVISFFSRVVQFLVTWITLAVCFYAVGYRFVID